MAANLRAAGDATSRPTTAISRVLDKISEVSGINLNLKLPLPYLQGDKPNGDRSFMHKKSMVSSKIMTLNLQAKISKILKSEQRLRQQKLQLIEDFKVWGFSISNVDSANMITEFGTLLSSQVDTSVILNEKLEILRLNLMDVHEREKKQKDLLHAQEKLLRQLKESEAKFGPGASGSTLIKEKLEENVCNLEVVELQYMRAINKNLKESIIEYLDSLRVTNTILEESLLVYYNCLLTIEQGGYNENNGTASNGGNVPTKPGQLVSEQLRKGSPIKSRKDFLYQAVSGAASSLRSQELLKATSYNSPSRKSSSSPYDHMQNNVNNQQLCSECSKLDKFTRNFTPCTHPSESRETQDYPNTREYLHSELWS